MVGKSWTAVASLSLLAAAMLSSCTVGPDFKKPAAAVPAAWAGPTTQPAATQPTQPTPAEIDLAAWWKLFGDPTLANLIDRAVAANLDLRIAATRIRQARSTRDVAVSGLGPVLDASGSYRRGQNAGARGVKPPVINSFSTGFDAGWEIDIFGGVRRGVEAAEADLQSTIEDRRDLLVTLTAEVAYDYVAIRTYQQRIAIAKRNLEAQKKSSGITYKRQAAGLVSKLDTVNADALVATTAAAIPQLEAAEMQTIYALSVLLDRAPADLVAELSKPSEIPSSAVAVPVGVASDLLRRRPDIRRAESNIHAATARIGVAVADLYPHVTISGSVGYSSTGNLSNLINPTSAFWSFGPSVSWNVFNTGRTLANIDIQKALTEQTILAYRQTVLTAMQEVESALVASTKEQQRRAALVEAVTANRQAVGYATDQYTQGLTDFLNVISAQRSLLSSEDALAVSDSALSANLIALFKALGGGWQEDQPAPKDAEPKK